MDIYFSCILDLVCFLLSLNYEEMPSTIWIYINRSLCSLLFMRVLVTNILFLHIVNEDIFKQTIKSVSIYIENGNLKVHRFCFLFLICCSFLQLEYQNVQRYFPFDTFSYCIKSTIQDKLFNFHLSSNMWLVLKTNFGLNILYFLYCTIQ